MPLYEYECTKGHRCEIMVRLNETGPIARCPRLLHEGPDPRTAADDVRCGAQLHRILSAPASVFPGADRWRK